ncbi:MAG TPA: hypothetical protein DEG92_01785 [Rikenellaceae bacterium]|nr:hypothetical protein [Rikenellaceae bacterium]
MFALLPAALSAQNTSEQERRKKQIEEEIAFLDKQLASTKQKYAANTKELTYIRRKIANRKKLLTEIENEIKAINNKMEEKEQQIMQLRNDLGQLKRDYSKLIYSAFKNRDQTSWLMYVLASDNLNQGFKRWAYFKEFNLSMQKRAGLIKNTSEQINSEVGELEKIKLSSIKVQTKKSQEFKKLQTDEQGAKRTISQLSQKEKEFRTQLNAKRKEVERLNREIERILSEAVKAKNSPGYKESTADRQLSDKFELNRGKLPWPVKRGAIVDEFGQHFHPVFKNIKLPFNNGVNIETDINAEVFSVFDGVVKQVLFMPGYNQCVLLQHGNYYTFYCKLEKVNVKSGDKVKTGESLGKLASSDENSSVIHFQLWNGTVKQNPESWISR